MAMAPSSSGGLTKYQGEEAILGVFFSTKNALYSIAFGTHTKMAEPIEMPFGMMSGLDPRNSVACGGNDAQTERDNFREKHGPKKA